MVAPSSDRRERPGPTAFGLGLLTDLPLPGAWQPRPLNEPTVQVLPATAEEIAHSWSGFAALGWEGTIDGAPFTVERGREGDHRFVHGAPPDAHGTPVAGTRARLGRHGTPVAHTRAIHHLCPDARVLRCAPSDPTDVTWWREVLDSALFTAALLHGYEALHAGAVATPHGAIAIAAASGGGKSTLLSELLARGYALMADDVLVLESAGAGPGGGRPAIPESHNRGSASTDANADGAPTAPRAHPGPPLMTVPAARLRALSEALAPAVPQLLASPADERWIALPVHPEPLPLAAVVVLNRAPGLDIELRPIEQPLAALLGALLRFPRTPARERSRFEMAGAIAARVPIWRLDADPGVTPGALAEWLIPERLIRMPYVSGTGSRC